MDIKMPTLDPNAKTFSKKIIYLQTGKKGSLAAKKKTEATNTSQTRNKKPNAGKARI